MTKLTENADLTHEDARGWYDSYGWHVTTKNEGDVTIDAVEYDWLDGTDAEAIAKLRETYDGLSDDEAESILAKAREVREAGEAVEGLLVEAVEAYQRGDMDAVVEALDEAARVESEHGDSPAANSLRSQLLDDDAEEDEGLVCGSQVQVDKSGVGHCWVDVAASDIPASIREEIEGEMIDGGKEECDDLAASDGLHYRW